RGDDAIHIVALEELLVALGRKNRFLGDLLRELDPAVVEVAGGHAFDAWKLDRSRHQARALHSDADDSEPNRVARWDRPGRGCRQAVGGFPVSVRVEHEPA